MLPIKYACTVSRNHPTQFVLHISYHHTFQKNDDNKTPTKLLVYIQRKTQGKPA